MIKSIRIVLVENGVEREVVFLNDPTPPPPPPAPTASLTPASITVEPGQAFTLAWATTDATDVTLNGMPVAHDGARELSLTADATYTLLAIGPSGRAEAQASVFVRPAPTATVLVNPPEVNAGEPVSVTWFTTGAELVSLEHDGVSEVVEAAGTKSFSPAQSTTYTVRASRLGHPTVAVASASVVVNAPAVVGATFVGKDPWTRGSWINRYGPDGHLIAGLPAALPSYVSASLPAPASLWVGQEHATSESAVSRPGSPDDRILAVWTAAYPNSPQDPGPFKLELTVEGRHQVALYFLSSHGPEPANRYMMVQAVNPATGEVYDTRHLGDNDLEFPYGVWLVYEVSGRVDFVFSRTGVQQRPVLNAVIFGGSGVPTPPPPKGPLSATLTAPAASEPGLPFTLSWSTANAAVVTLDGVGAAFSGSRTEELHASRTYALEAIYPNVPNASATATVAVSPPPPTGDGYNVLLRGQSNAQYFAEYGGLARLRELMQARLGKRVNLVYAARHPLGRNTAVSATAFVREFFANGQPTANEVGVLGRIAEVPEADRARPTLTIWMHNEYDGGASNPPLTQAEVEAAYRADMALVRPLLGAGRSPYAYVWVPFTPGASSPAVRAAQDALVADPASLAYRAPDILSAHMDGPSHISRGGAAAIADMLAGPLCDILLAVDAPPPPPPAPTGALAVEPASVVLGGTATLRWSSTNASSATLDGVAVPLSGEKSVSPLWPTLYELKLTGPGGEVTYRATLDVVTPSPTGSLTVSPSSIVSGQTATLSWASQHASSATLDGVAVALSGSMAVQPTQNHSYVLTLSGPGGSVTYTVSVAVSQLPPPPSGVMGTATVSVDKSDHVVTAGETVTVTATVADAVQVWVQSLEGRIDLSPTGGTFTLTPKVSGPFPLLALDANGGVTVKPMSVIVKADRPAISPLVPATLATVKDGALDDPATWGGRLPSFDEVVEVRHVCTYSGRRFWCARLINKGVITVKGGVLHTTDYDDAGIGSLTLDGRDVDKALVMLHNRPKHADDTADFWRCVRVRGKLVIRGKPATRRLELAAPAKVGDTLIRLASPCQGWGPGQKILLHDTRMIKHNDDAHREEEIAVIRGVSDGGLTVHLLSPLRYDHLPCLERDGSVAFRPKVFHLIANAGFVTSDPTTVSTRCHIRVEGKAHLDCDNWLVHGTGRSASGARFGSTVQERNPLRLHDLVGPDGGVDGEWQWRMTNGVTLDPPPIVPIGGSQVSWGVTLDNTHYGLYENNVSFNWDGAHHVLFSGNETDNLFKGNSAIALPWVGHSENNYGNYNVGHTAAGFWSRGPGSRFVDNFASGLYRPYVIAPYMHGEAHLVRVPAHRGADVKAGQFVVVNIRNTPLREFGDNEAGGYVVNYLELWGVGADGHGTSPALGFRESLVLGVKAWRFRDHVYYNYMTAGVTFDGVKAREGSLGFFSSDYMAYQFRIKNADIRGVNTGVLTSPLYDQVYENCYIEAFTGIEVGLLWASGWSAQNIPPRHVVIKGLRWSPLPESFPAWWGPQRAVKMSGQPFWGPGASNSCNFVAINEVHVEGFQGNPADNFRLYFLEQAADQPCPATVAHPLEPTPSNPNPVQTYRYWGCPEANLTNAQAWAKYGVAFGGSVAPSGCVERETIAGLVKVG